MLLSELCSSPKQTDSQRSSRNAKRPRGLSGHKAGKVHQLDRLTFKPRHRLQACNQLASRLLSVNAVLKLCDRIVIQAPMASESRVREMPARDLLTMASEHATGNREQPPLSAAPSRIKGTIGAQSLQKCLGREVAHCLGVTAATGKETHHGINARAVEHLETDRRRC